MNASKENARVALERLNLIAREDCSNDEWLEALSVIRAFLNAAEKRLPSEAAIAKDKERRKTRNTVIVKHTNLPRVK